jgi:uncharacterized glyoxalase superfamily protein PhnB
MSNNYGFAPEGFHSITPLLRVRDASKLIDFLKQAFGAKEISRYAQKDGSLMHAEVKIGDSMVMLSDSASDCKPTTCVLYLYVDDADKRYERALEFGATSLRKPRDEFYGDRCAAVIDPFGNQWWIATNKKKESGGEELDDSSDNDMDQIQTFSI